MEAVKDGRLLAFKHIFGAEPHDAEVLAFVNGPMLPRLESVTRGTIAQPVEERRLNPKRLARLAARELERSGVSTASQEAMKLELEHRKRERKVASREQRLAEEARRFELARRKAKAKHRGR